MIDKNRLAETFQSLVSIDSVSREEGRLARELAKSLAKLGAETRFDTAGEKVGGDTGNLIARLKGNALSSPLLLSAHMDTVEPGKGVTAILQDGVFTSDGTTILGADDKSALAIILETLQVLKEDRIVHGPLEIVLTICEEVGLLGAKHLDYDLLTATYGYVLDATDTDGIVTRAPAANRLELVVHGKASHAGSAPENGINAIWLAGQAIGGLSLGRVDRETTCNIGVIEGGIATNIVPDKVIVKGEVRSHDPKKLQAVTDTIVSAFQKAVDACCAERYDERTSPTGSQHRKRFSRDPHSREPPCCGPCPTGGCEPGPQDDLQALRRRGRRQHFFRKRDFHRCSGNRHEGCSHGRRIRGAR